MKMVIDVYKHRSLYFDVSWETKIPSNFWVILWQDKYFIFKLENKKELKTWEGTNPFLNTIIICRV